MLLFTSLFSAAGGFGAGAPPPAFTIFGDGNGSAGGGSSSREWVGNNMMAQRYQVPVAGLVVSVSAWCNSQSANMRMALYSNNGSNLPDALLAEAPGRSVVPTASWEDFELDPADYVPVAVNDMLWICAQTSADIWGSNASAPVQTLARRLKAAQRRPGTTERLMIRIVKGFRGHPGTRSRAGATRPWTVGSMPGPPPPSAASIAGPTRTGASSNDPSNGRNKSCRPPPARTANRSPLDHPGRRLAAGSSTRARTGSASRRGGHGGTAEQPVNGRQRRGRQHPAGNLKPAKDKSTERIDGIVATIMAIGRAMVAQDEPQPEYSMFFV